MLDDGGDVDVRVVKLDDLEPVRAREGGAVAGAPPRVLRLVARRADEAGELAELLAVLDGEKGCVLVGGHSGGGGCGRRGKKCTLTVVVHHSSSSPGLISPVTSQPVVMNDLVSAVRIYACQS